MRYDLNIEELHAQWLDDFERIAWSYGEENYGERPCIGLVCKVDDSFEISDADIVPDVGMVYDDDLRLKVVGTVKLPCGTDHLIKEMAKFSRMNFNAFQALPALNSVQNMQFVENMFCLKSVLLASFPKNPQTGWFRGNIGPDAVLCLDDFAPEKKPFCAFSGVGVILLNAARKMLDPVGTDERIALYLSDQLILGIVEGNIK